MRRCLHVLQRMCERIISTQNEQTVLTQASFHTELCFRDDFIPQIGCHHPHISGPQYQDFRGRKRIAPTPLSLHHHILRGIIPHESSSIDAGFLFVPSYCSRQRTPFSPRPTHVSQRHPPCFFPLQYIFIDFFFSVFLFVIAFNLFASSPPSQQRLRFGLVLLFLSPSAQSAARIHRRRGHHLEAWLHWQ